MIDTIEIKNFECHKNTKIDCSDGLNVIAGSSNSGKSSILRAISWVVFNDPKGYGFKPIDSDERTEVTITTSTETVTRFRSKKENGYIVNDETFSAINNDIPIQVTQALPMSSINFQGQFDQFFLLQETPGNIGKQINKVTNLEVFDIAMGRANKEIRQLSSNIKYDKDKLNQVKQDIIKKQWVVVAVTAQQAIADSIEFRKVMELKSKILKEELKKLNDVKKLIETSSNKIADTQDVTCKVEQYNQLLIKQDYLIKNLKVLQLCKKRVESDIPELPVDKIKSWESLVIDTKDLKNKLQSIKELKKIRELLCVDILKFESQRDNIITTLEECPSCGAYRKDWRK